MGLRPPGVWDASVRSRRPAATDRPSGKRDHRQVEMKQPDSTGTGPPATARSNLRLYRLAGEILGAVEASMFSVRIRCWALGVAGAGPRGT
jgi:hypothetical protein